MMKKLVCIIFMLLFAIVSFADEKDLKVMEENKKGVCPKTNIAGTIYDCLKCHTYPNFKLRESQVEELYDVPGSGTKLIFENGKPVSGYLLYNDIDPENVETFIVYLDRKGIKHLTIEIYSPGGNMFKAWRTVGIMNIWKEKGFVIETVVKGYAASAGFMVFCAGSQGHRIATPQAELMWHELVSFKLFDISTPSDKEDEAKILRHFQDSSNTWLASVSKVSKEDLDDKIRKREFWMNGKEALKYGFADKLIGCGIK